MAGSAVIGALRVNLGLDSATFSSGLKKAESNVIAFSQKSTSSFRGLRTGVQGAAFQIQDLAVQMEMGTSAARAFSQQLPQMLGGFGALGAAIGVVAAIAIPLSADTFNRLAATGADLAKSWSETSVIAQEFGEAMHFLGENIDHIAVAAASLAGFMAAKWVAGFVAAQVATASLSGALIFLRGAIIKTGIGALVVGAGELVYQFTKLVQATGGWGEALTFLGEVASGVWDGIKTSAQAIGPALSSVFSAVKAEFLLMAADITSTWVGVLETFKLNTDAAVEATRQMLDASDTAYDSSHASAAQASAALSTGFENASAAAGKLAAKVKEADGWSWSLGDGMAEVEDKTGGAAKKAKDLAKNLKESVKPTEQFLEAIEKSQRAVSGISSAMQSIASGQNVTSSVAGGITGFADAMWGEQSKKQFDDLAKKINSGLSSVFSKMGAKVGLSGQAAAGVGMGIANAAAGAMEHDSAAIGSGIGAAAGAVIGTFLLPGIGTSLGAMLGGTAGGLLGSIGGGEEKWKRPTGTAFQGTTFESAVVGSRNVNVESGASQAGKFAFQGTVNLLADFNKELGQYVESLGGTMERGLKLVVDNDAALRKITGTISDRTVNRGGESEDDAAARISKRVSEIMGLAAMLAEKSGPALTETQTLWRETQERFSKTNVLILKDLGFAAREIRDLQGDIKDDLREGFSKGLLDSLVDSGRASRKEIDSWRKYELDSLEERRKAAVRTAREIGASVDLVNSAFRAERKEIGEEYRGLLDDMVKSTQGLQERMARLESKRASILQELTKRSDEALRAEEALRDARRGLAGGALAPGGPRDVFSALKGQFADAIKAAKGGDADAATRAAGLASALLESGRGVFASGTDYAALFKSVNEQLLNAQKSFDARGDKLARALDDKTFKDVQERSTRALLSGLQRLDERLEEVAHEIKRQTRETRRDGQRKSVG
jgi:hypothetical protein